MELNTKDLKALFEERYRATRFKTENGILYMQRAPSRGFVVIGYLNEIKDAEVITEALNQILVTLDEVEGK